MRTPFSHFRNGWTDYTEIWCVARGPVAMRTTRDGKLCTNASVTVTYLSTSTRSRSFIAQKASYWLVISVRMDDSRCPQFVPCKVAFHKQLFRFLFDVRTFHNSNCNLGNPLLYEYVLAGLHKILYGLAPEELFKVLFL